MDQVPAKDQLQGIGSGAVSLNAKNVALFVQDDLKLTPHVMINAGLHYEYFGNPACARNQERNSVSDLPGTPRVFHTPGTGTGRTGTVAHFVCRNSSGATSVASSAGGCVGSAYVVGYVAANPNARYVQAGQGAIANVGRNTVDSEHFNLWNMSLFKNFDIREGKRLQFRFELFNAFNVGQYALGNADVAPVQVSTNAVSPSYANVTAANFLNARQFDRQGRSFQLGLKFSF
jgi:hypothetical protein